MVYVNLSSEKKTIGKNVLFCRVQKIESQKRELFNTKFERQIERELVLILLVVNDKNIPSSQKLFVGFLL